MKNLKFLWASKPIFLNNDYEHTNIIFNIKLNLSWLNIASNIRVTMTYC